MMRVSKEKALEIISETRHKQLELKTKEELIKLVLNRELAEYGHLPIPYLSNALAIVTGNNLGVVRTDLGDTE